jgi:CRISPR/Cas system-associated exonuclease Cas4 (RecB family)
MIKSWSFSRLVDWDSCKQKAYFKHDLRIPDPNPSPAADRGTAIHQLAEDYVNGKLKKLPQELAKFRTEFESLRAKYLEGQVSLEGEWGFDCGWGITEWKTAWGRIKADAVVTLTPSHTLVIDYKTGKKFGNELKHAEQLQLYSLAVILRNPDIQQVTSELWYLDIDDLTSVNVTRQQALTKYLKHWDKKAVAMTSATVFPANPNQFSCKWCPYSPRGTGDCKVGV